MADVISSKQKAAGTFGVLATQHANARDGAEEQLHQERGGPIGG